MRRFSPLLGFAVLVACSGREDPAGTAGSGNTAGTETKAGSGGTAAAAAGTGGASSGGPSAAGSNTAGEDTHGGAPGGESSGGASASGGSSGSATAGKPSNGGSGARPPVDTHCDLPNPAFCDAFTKASPGGRAGDLDDSKWSFARLGFACGSVFSFPPTPLNLCGVWQTVSPGGQDSQFCTDENDVPHWAEGFDDNTSFNYLGARIRQPFDFQGRMGTIEWEADARTSGSHGWWVETWITDAPVPGVNVHNDQVVASKEAVGIELSLNCGMGAAGLGTAGSGKVGVSRIMIVHDYVVTDAYDPFSGPLANQRCVTTEQSVLNKFQFKISDKRVEVWASNAGSTDLTQIAEADVDLPFSRGYVHIGHVHYNAHKADVTPYQSYQWARVAFDGPQLATPRAYEIPDALSEITGDAACTPGYRISYGVQDGVTYDLGTGPDKPVALVFEDVDPEGGTAARVNFNTTFVEAGNTLRFRLNGKEWRDYEVPDLETTWERQGFSVPLPVADLVAGDNTLEIATDTASFALPPNGMHIANIDLEVEVP